MRAEGKLVVTDLSEALGVSEDMVRRDLREVAEAGKLQRVHGGALPRSAVTGTHEARKPNPDRYCPFPGGRGEPDAASIVAAIEACTGTLRGEAEIGYYDGEG